MSLSKGSIIEFSCFALLEVKWFHKEKDNIPEVHEISHHQNFSIENISHKKAGYYYCYGLDINSKSPFIARSHLKIYGRS